MRISCSLATAIVISLVGLGASGNASDPFMLGKASYAAGNPRQALLYFKQAAATQPKNPAIRYYLAITLVQLHLIDQAKVEFQTTVALQPQGQAAKYSQAMLAALAGKTAAIPEISQSQSREKDNLKKAVLTIHDQTAEQNLIDKTDREANAMLSGENQRAISILREADERAYEMRNATVWVGDVLRPAYSEDQIEAVLDEAKERAQHVKDVANHRASEMREQSRAHTLLVEDAATTLDSQLVDNAGGDVKLMPQGTSLYVRNYQIKPEEDGAPIPLAAQAKKLQLKQTSKIFNLDRTKQALGQNNAANK